MIPVRIIFHVFREVLISIRYTIPTHVKYRLAVILYYNIRLIVFYISAHLPLRRVSSLEQFDRDLVGFRDAELIVSTETTMLASRLEYAQLGDKRHNRWSRSGGVTVIVLYNKTQWGGLTQS